MVEVKVTFKMTHANTCLPEQLLPVPLSLLWATAMHMAEQSLREMLLCVYVC